MIIRVKCNKNVELNQFHNLESIELNVLSYKLEKDTLNGDVKINGVYALFNSEDKRNFEDIVPFLVVFRDENIKIDNIEIENKVFDIIETGIDINFDLVVNYSLLEKIENTQEVEVPVEIEEVMPVFSNNVYDKIQDDYDKKLENIMNTRNTLIYESKKDANISFKNLKSDKKTISVFYFEKESEIEKISKQSQKTIQEIYNDNKDLNNKKRIVIHE